MNDQIIKAIQESGLTINEAGTRLNSVAPAIINTMPHFIAGVILHQSDSFIKNFLNGWTK